MDPYYTDDSVTLYYGDCLDVLRAMPDASVDSVVTDPPYGLEFMGKDWDAPWKASSVGRGARVASERAGELTECGKGHSTSAGPYLATGVDSVRVAGRPFQDWCQLWAAECLRVLKPGGHMLAFGGSRTFHRLACGAEDAGFEIRDSIAWLYGQGFPKSLDVSKAITGHQMGHGSNSGAIRRATMGEDYTESGRRGNRDGAGRRDTGLDAHELSLTPDAATWQGWGTALKPSHEPVVHGVKPFGSSSILARIGSQLDALEDSCRPHVKGAAKSSAPIRHDLHEARTATAPEPVATPHEDEQGRTTPTGTVAGSFGATATSASASTAGTFWSTVTSWRACWAELSEATSTSTTSTATSRTTDLQTLLSCLSRITQNATVTSTLEQDSLRSLVTAVDNLFAAGVLSSRSTLALSAIESAISATQPTSQVAGGSSPAHEPIVVGRKPLTGTVAANVLTHGTGALNVDGCRVPGGGGGTHCANRDDLGACKGHGNAGRSTSGETFHGPDSSGGRWPTNVVLDESQAADLDAQTGVLTSGLFKGHRNGDKFRTAYGEFKGGASRFFPTFRYEAKAPAVERPRVGETAHPTVKPLALMQWLVKLVTPPGGTVLEPFAGSGTTTEACVIEGFKCIAIEREADYLPLIVQRLSKPIQVGLDFGESA